MIRGRKVALRPVEESDYPLIHRWMNNAEVWRFMDYDRLYSMSDVRRDVEESRETGQPFTILVDGRPVGRIGLNQFRAQDRICSFYMYVGEPTVWGKGYARDAAMAILAYAFDRQDLNLVELWALADNDRAIRMYQRCGFVVEATLRQRSFKEGRWLDHVHMSVSREEFASARRAWEQEENPTIGPPSSDRLGATASP